MGVLPTKFDSKSPYVLLNVLDTSISQQNINIAPHLLYYGPKPHLSQFHIR